MDVQDRPDSRLLPALALLIVGLYLLLHPYQGLVHDARLYTLLALNHLHPELYGNDVFLKYGSQDSYTLFTPLYTAAMALLGAEPSAKLITLVSIMALLISAWWLARTMMPAPLAWLGLGLFVLTPGYYGPDQIFALLEGFVTPRMLAQALSLLSLAAWLRERRLLSGVLLLTGMLIHPIMTLPAAILLLVVGWGLPHWRRLWPLALAGMLAMAAALAGWVPLSPWQFEDALGPLAEWAPHLVLGEWNLHDWARAATVLATLYFAALYLPHAGWRLALGMLITGGLTLLLSWLGGDLLKIAVVVQGQAWRSLWLATALAVLLLPWLAARCWAGPPLRRCGLLLLLTAWIIGHTSLALCFSIPAMIAIACSGTRLPERIARLTVHTAGILLVVVFLCLLALTLSERGSSGSDDKTAMWLQFLRAACDDRLLPGVALLAIWYAAMRIRTRAMAAVLTLAVALPVACLGTEASKPWLRQNYPREVQQAFSSWRALIPPGSDVLWATQLFTNSDPSGAWLLLERPSYYSSVQSNSGLFSRPAALELRSRSRAIPLSLPTEQPINIIHRGKEGEAPLCADIPVRYIVTETVIPDAQVISAPASPGPPFDRLKLQICP